MDKEWVERQIWDHREKKEVATKPSEWVTHYDYVDDFSEASAVIAQAHEQELANAIARTRAEMVGDVQRLEAQVAMMAETLRFVRSDWFERYYPSDIFTGVSGDEGVLDVIEIKKRLDQALSAAPKVVSVGTFGLDDMGWLDLRARTGPILGAPEEQGVYFEGNLEPGSEVEVFVTECSVKDTCKRAPEQGQNSEHGYKRARGVIPWHEGDELPEDTIARIRGSEQESEQEHGDDSS